MNTSNVTISVIVPVYNAEKYLRKCVDSILAQTYTDFELLLINDGSKDQSGEILEEYASNDVRVRTFHKLNGGVSSARNLGLDRAIGKWIVFVDADDWVSKDYLHNLLKNSTNVDLVLNYAVIHKNGIEITESYPEKFIKIENLSNLFKYSDLIWHTSPWGKLFKRSIIVKNKLQFPLNMHIGEDAVFLFQYILNIRNIKVICICDYHYIINNSTSLTQRINDFSSEYGGYERILDVYNAFCEKLKIDDYTKQMFLWLLGSYMRRCLIALYYDKYDRKQRIDFLSNTDFTNYLNGFKEDSIQGKIYMVLLRLRAFSLYDILRSTLTKLSEIFSH